MGIYGVCRGKKYNSWDLKLKPLTEIKEVRRETGIMLSFLINISGSQGLGKGENLSCPLIKRNASCFICFAYGLWSQSNECLKIAGGSGSDRCGLGRSLS